MIYSGITYFVYLTYSCPCKPGIKMSEGMPNTICRGLQGVVTFIVTLTGYSLSLSCYKSICCLLHLYRLARFPRCQGFPTDNSIGQILSLLLKIASASVIHVPVTLSTTIAQMLPFLLWIMFLNI